jgi:hypothetical protein
MVRITVSSFGASDDKIDDNTSEQQETLADKSIEKILKFSG